MIPKRAYDMFSGTVAERDDKDQLLCPHCKKPMEKVSKLPKRYECKEHGQFRIRQKRKRRPFDIEDQSTWKATCSECGGIMDYLNLKYCCRKCGSILEV